MARYLGLDLGSHTLGMAISDSTATIATAYQVLRHNEEYDRLVDEVGKVLTEKQIDAIVLGLPKNMNNTISEKGNLSLSFRDKLEKRYHIPVYLQDERLTTVQAQNTLLLFDTSRQKRKRVVDKIAATIILQSYLDQKRKIEDRKD